MSEIEDITPGYLETPKGNAELAYATIQGGVDWVYEDLHAATKFLDSAMLGINALKERLVIDAIEDWQ